MDTVSLRQLLQRYSVKGSLYRTLDDGNVECFACGHRCIIRDGRDGICKVRFNQKGILRVPHGYFSGIQLDPIEKKPFFHAFPGSQAMSFGMLGCDYHCPYCQNWITSQTLRDPNAQTRPEILDAEDFILLAVRNNAQVVTSTYNEPLISSEWAVEIFRLAKRYGLVTSYVSNGNGTPEVIEYLTPWLDLFKIDLKGFNDRQYRRLGGVLQNVLDTIRRAVSAGLWVEIVTLIVPGINDSEEELKDLSSFIASVSPDIPWHVTAFHGDYKMSDAGSTSPSTLLRAIEIGRQAGLKFVYAGNIPGHVGNAENTYCPRCHALLIERWGFRVRLNALTNGSCHTCGEVIPGRWTTAKNKRTSGEDV